MSLFELTKKEKITEMLFIYSIRMKVSENSVQTSDVLPVLTEPYVPAEFILNVTVDTSKVMLRHCIYLVSPAGTDIRSIAEYEMEIKTSIRLIIIC